MKQFVRNTLLFGIIHLLFLFPSFLIAQFTEVTAISDSLPTLSIGRTEWADYDLDGDLDLLTGGYYSTDIVRNDNGVLIQGNLSFPTVRSQELKWADYDGDGDLDFALAGYDSTAAIVRIFRNDGGVFQDIHAPVLGIRDCHLEWGDYDNDGDLDFVLSGVTGDVPGTTVIRIYRNDAGSFFYANLGEPGNFISTPKWGDFDNDGDLDLLLSGYSPAAGIYRNDEGSFIQRMDSILPMRTTAVATGDYDNDGDLDVAISGDPFGGNPWVTKVFRNDAGTFVDAQLGLTGLKDGSLNWGDYDNDGDLDLFSTGSVYTFGSILATKLYRNDTGLLHLVNAGLPNMTSPGTALLDFDKDGDLDLVLMGRDQVYVAHYYRNDDSIANTPPQAPTQFAATAVGDSAIRYTWDAAIDNETPSLGLSYRLWIGTAIDSFNVTSPLADTATGWRGVAKTGNLQGTAWTLKHIVSGQTYFACVSAIDAGFMGSPCSEKASIMVVGSPSPAQEPALAVTAGPNPTADWVHISASRAPTSAVAYKLTNLAGQSLRGFSGDFKGALDLDLSALPAGVYLLRLEGDRFVGGSCLRIIKE